MVVLDASTLRTLGRIRVGQTPWGAAFTSNGASAYVSNANDNTVSVIDTATQSVTNAIGIGSFTYTDTTVSPPTTFPQLNQIPTAVALAPDNTMWVACNVSGSVAVIDTTANAVVSTVEIGLGDEPTGIAFA